MKTTKYKIGETAGFPFEKGSGNVPGRGSSVFPITLKKNVTMLHEFLYGTKDYQPSSKVVSISGAIASVVGNREVEPNSTWQDNGQNNTTDPNANTNNSDNLDAPNNSTKPDNPETDNPGTDNPGTDNPGTDNPGTDNPGTDNPGTDNPGTDNPGTDNPGTDNPGTDNPGTDNPGTGMN